MTRPSSKLVGDFRRVFTFAVVTNVLDVITTHFRDPHLLGEGNPVYQLLASHGLTGWIWLILIKLGIGGLLAVAYWVYLRRRHLYLPREPARCIRSLIWQGMWDGKPYPRSLWLRLVNLRKLEFGVLLMMAIGLPASAVAALFFSVDNVFAALHHPLPYLSFSLFVPLTTVGMFVWWSLAYWQYYQSVAAEVHAAPGN